MNRNAYLLFLPIVLLSPIITFAAGSGVAQSAIGFTDPNDLEALLDYRLPTWSYRTWTVAGSMSGGGRDQAGNDKKYINNRFTSRLSSDLVWRRMSDLEDRWLSASIEGGYNRIHNGDEGKATTQHDLNGNVDANGMFRHYLQPGGVWGGVSFRASRSYTERVKEDTRIYIEVEPDIYSRYTGYSIDGKIGVGRVRDVTPVVRAQRFNERLSVLGRPRLTASQVRQLGNILATEQGYRVVLDRPDKNFWSDVLEPMLDDQRPLTPYEIFYLRDVLEETIGSRSQGGEVGLIASYRGGQRNLGQEDYISDERALGVFGAWGHVLSLTHQLRADAQATYRWSAVSGQKTENAFVSGRLYHMWSLADRYNLRTSASVSGSYNERNAAVTRRGLTARVGSVFRAYVENSLALVASAEVSNMQASDDHDFWPDRGWQWTYRVGLEYALDRVLY